MEFNAEEERKRIESMKSEYDAWKTASTEKLEEARQGINRMTFDYNPYSDAIYQQYKKQYSKQAKLAMKDTMANAATLTGGYGNSYATTVGSQSYQGWMDKLNDIIPELYDLALSRFNSDRENAWRDYNASVSAFNRELSDRTSELDREWSDFLSKLENQTGETSDTDSDKFLAPPEGSKEPYDTEEIKKIIAEYGLDVNGFAEDENKKGWEKPIEKGAIPEDVRALTDYLYNDMGYGDNNTWNMVKGLAERIFEIPERRKQEAAEEAALNESFAKSDVEEFAAKIDKIISGGTDADLILDELSTWISTLPKDQQAAAQAMIDTDENGMPKVADGYNFARSDTSKDVKATNGRTYTLKSGIAITKDKEINKAMKDLTENEVFVVKGKGYIKIGNAAYEVLLK